MGNTAARKRLPIIGVALTVSLGALAQVPTKCLEIESVLVDACNNSCPGANEGENEMFRFITGPNAIALANLTATWSTQNNFLGWVQNGATASVTAQLNATITNCGWLLEPPGGIIPSGRRVLGITSTNVCITGNSFAALSDTLYVIYQAPGNTFGHFKNHNNSNAITAWPSGPNSFRTFILRVGACADSVVYNEAQLVNQLGSYGGTWAQNDGSTVNATWPGAPQISYVNYGCQAPITPLTATIAGAPPPAPCGGTIALQASAAGNIASVIWSGGSGSFSAPTSSSTSYTLGAGDANGTVLTFCAVSICGDTVCDQVQIATEPPPQPSLGNLPAALPCGAPAQLSASVSGNAVSTFWGGGTGTWAPNGLTATYTPSLTESGLVNLRFCAVGSCGDTLCAPFAINIQGGPTASITPSGPATVCAGASITLTGGGGTSYLWSTGATGPSITVGAAGTYTVTAINACGQADASIAVAVTPLPVASASGPPTACPEQTITLTAAGGSSYTWSHGANGSTVQAVGPGAYTVTVSDACGSDTATVVVAPGEPYQPSFTSSLTEGCAPLCATFTAAALSEAEYAWSASDGSAGSGSSFTHCFSPGTHDVTLSVASNGYSPLCPASITLPGIVTSWQVPVASFTASPWTTTIEQPTIRFADLSAGADSVAWRFGIGDSVSAERAPAFTYDSIACYTVRLLATNAQGCTDEAAHEVCVEPPFTLWVPNAFTPNGDGFNDAFFAVTSVASPRIFELLIYNRWGQLVFRGDAPGAGWDGGDAPNDLYVWKLRIRDTLGDDHERMGHVVLVR